MTGRSTKPGFFDEAIGEVDSSGYSYAGTGLFNDLTGRRIRGVGAGVL